MMIYFKCKGTFVIGSRKTVVYGCVGFLPSSVTAFLVRVDSKKWYESVFMIWSQGILHTHTHPMYLLSCQSCTCLYVSCISCLLVFAAPGGCSCLCLSQKRQKEDLREADDCSVACSASYMHAIIYINKLNILCLDVAAQAGSDPNKIHDNAN